MSRKIEAVIEPDGTVRLLEDVNFDTPRRAIVTIFEDDEEPASAITLLSERALAQDWDRPEEEDAWKHLQRGP